MFKVRCNVTINIPQWKHAHLTLLYISVPIMPPTLLTVDFTYSICTSYLITLISLRYYLIVCVSVESALFDNYSMTTVVAKFFVTVAVAMV